MGARALGSNGIQRGLRRFAAADGGNVAIIFAAVIIPVSGIVSAAIDFGRAAKVRSTLQTAASAAAQAGSARLDEGSSAVEQQVRAMLDANLPQQLAGLPHRLVVPSDRSSVEVAMETTVPTTLMGILGVRELAVEATGFAKRPVPETSPTESGGSGAPTEPEADAAIGRTVDALLGGAEPGPGTFARGGGQLPAIQGKADLEAMAQQAAEQLRDMQSRIGPGGSGGLPPEAAAEIERLMRSLAGARR